MRSWFAALPLLSLAACGGAGTEGAPAGFGAPPPAATTPDPAPAPTSQANLFDVSATATFDAVGSLHSVKAAGNGVLYKGNASTVAAPSGTITYNPRDGIFTLRLEDEAAAGVKQNVNFQDPAHRTTADSARVGEYQVPLLAGFNYLQALNEGTTFTFFYQRPNATGSFVSLGGFESSIANADAGTFEAQRGVFVFGSKTADMQVPTKGAGRYDGQFLATMVGDRAGAVPLLQWINGTSAVDVDFSARTVGLSLNGVVSPAYVKNELFAGGVAAGSTFTATGSASYAGGANAFAGKFTSAGFTIGGRAVPVDFTPVRAGTAVAGATSIDGAFYGPNAKNVGGNFRITGGVPDQRVDILGAFVGTKK